MKVMTCRELGGACEETFRAATFEEMAELSKQHGVRMYELGDAGHIDAMKTAQTRMEIPGAIEGWMRAMQDKFDALPNAT